MATVAKKPRAKKVSTKTKASSGGSSDAPHSGASRKPVAKIKATPKSEAISKLRIGVRAYEHKLLDASVKQIMDTALRYDAEVQRPTPLPTEIKKYTVNRLSFVHKNAREQFEMRVHKRLIDILNSSPKLIEALTNLSLPSGVNIDVKMV